jgi:small-conductance mechanosensitive channel
MAIGLAFLCAIFNWSHSTGAQVKEIPVGLPAKRANFKLPMPDEIQEKVQALKEKILLAQKTETEKSANQLGVSLKEIREQTATLEATQSIYMQLLTAVKKKIALKEEENFLLQKLSTQEKKGVSQDPPYFLSFYDNLLGELSAAQQQKSTLAFAVKFAKKSSENITSRFEKAAGQWRTLKEQIEIQPPEAVSRSLAWRFEKAEAEKDYLEALFYLEKATQENQEIELQIAKLREQLYLQQVVWVRNHLTFNEADLQKQLNSLTNKRKVLAENLEKLTREQKKAEEAWLEALKKLKMARNQNESIIAEAALKARQAWHTTYQNIIEQMEDTSRLLGHQEDTVRKRHTLIRGEVDTQKLTGWNEEAEDYLANLENAITLQQNYQANLQSQISTLEKEIAEGEFGAEVKNHLENQLGAMQTLANHRFEYISTILLTEQVDSRLVEEISLKLDKIPIGRKASRIWDEIQSIWNFEIWVIDNRPVTVRKLIVSFFILIIGILIAKYLVRILTRRLLSFARLKETTASAFQKMLLFLAYLLVFLFALRMVNIPVAAFAFLGGAIAIGVGFGAQNLINNFISGFIIMAERPISIGDLIEIEGILGQVEDIGARSTRVRTGENIHILVPNSSFLEKNITNWTLSDKKIRTRVTVGVIYGSPVECVKKLLLEATKGIENLLPEPEPFVLFNDFGDNALIFDVYFWISIRQIIERRKIESSVRFRVDALFREAGLVIAFPQRDVHLDTQKPLELRLIDEKKDHP